MQLSGRSFIQKNKKLSLPESNSINQKRDIKLIKIHPPDDRCYPGITSKCLLC